MSQLVDALVNTAVLRERKPSPRLCPQPKVIRFWINPDSDPDVCQISPGMLQIHYVVGISHFAECRENLPVTV